MKNLYQLSPGQLIVWITPRASKEQPLDLVAYYAVRGHVEMVTSGEGFDMKQIIHTLQRQTDQTTEALSRIRFRYASTCYQLIRILEDTRASAVPCIALDFLETFYDESISTAESYYLLGIAVGHLHRLRKYAPFVVCIYPARIHQPDRSKLVNIVLEIADYVFTGENPQPDLRTRS